MVKASENAPTGTKGGNWAAVVAAGVLAALTLGWWFVQTPVPEPMPAMAHRSSAPILTAADAGQAASTPRFVAPASVGHSADEVQVCGGAWVHRDAEGRVALADLATAYAAEAASKRLVATLRADRSARAQGLVLYLEDAPEALARFATAGTDPAVYHWALQRCGFGRPGRDAGACDELSLARWAQLDPDNAQPWMNILADVVRHRDTTLAEEALHRVSVAPRSDSGRGAFAGTFLEHQSDDPADLGANWMMLIAMDGLQAAWTTPGFVPLLDMCRGDALNDANRRQVCEGVATTLVDRSDDQLTEFVGIAIGNKLAWPVDRLDRLRGEQRLYLNDRLALAPDIDIGMGPGIGGSCDDMRRMLTSTSEVARLGETGARRAWIERSGKNDEDFISEGRHIRAQRDAAAAVSGARSALTASGAFSR